MFRVEKAVPERDYNRLAELYDAGTNRPITAQDLHARDGEVGMNDFRMVFAAWLNDAIIGYAECSQSARTTDNRINIWLTIDHAYRQQGYGTQLYEHVHNIASEREFSAIHSHCLDNDTISLNFAKDRGYTTHNHIFHNVLDLTQFDITTWQPYLQRPQENGVVFKSLAEIENNDATQYEIYELHKYAQRDNPMHAGVIQTNFEQLKKSIFNAFWFSPEMMQLAYGANKIIGMGITSAGEGYELARNGFLGVYSAYRGRGIGVALKLRGIEYALSKGAKRLSTNNDGTNYPVLAINKKLGFVRDVGTYYLRKPRD